jgi:hypothetical protein
MGGAAFAGAIMSELEYPPACLLANYAPEFGDDCDSPECWRYGCWLVGLEMPEEVVLALLYDLVRGGLGK